MRVWQQQQWRHCVCVFAISVEAIHLRLLAVACLVPFLEWTGRSSSDPNHTPMHDTAEGVAAEEDEDEDEAMAQET